MAEDTKLPPPGSKVWVVPTGAGPYFVIDVAPRGIGGNVMKATGKEEWAWTTQQPVVLVASSYDDVKAPEATKFREHPDTCTWVMASMLDTQAPRRHEPWPAWLGRHGRRAVLLTFLLLVLQASTAGLLLLARSVLRERTALEASRDR